MKGKAEGEPSEGRKMKNPGMVKAIIAILAVISIGLFVLLTVRALNPSDNEPINTADVAGYGMVEEEPESTTEMVESANGNFYSVEDEGTMEMDSIPNDAGAPDVSADNAG